MRHLLVPLAALLLSQALLLVGHGLQLTLLPVRAQIEGFTDAQIGLTGSAYFLGFVVGCLGAPHIIRRVGHIRSFAVLGSSFSAVVLLFHAIPVFYPWLFLRLLVGICISGLYMIIESWLNDRATRETRGTLLSIYTIINLTMIMVGQQMLNLAEPESDTLFAIAAVLLSVAIIPVSLTLSLAPAPLTTVRLDLRRIWSLSRVGMAGSFAAGLVTGAFWSLGPIYARGLELATAQLTLFMSAAVLGGAIFQLPLGRLSDHYDRRLVILILSLAGAGVSASLMLIPGTGWWLLFLSFLWGGTAMTLYAICLAHTTDHAQPDDFVMVGSGILLIFGLGSAVGGPAASLLMNVSGPSGLFAFSALAMLVFAGGIARRRRTHVVPLHDETEPFRLMVDSATPVAFEMDPRTEEGHLAEADYGQDNNRD
jgi:MFS family permease